MANVNISINVDGEDGFKEKLGFSKHGVIKDNVFEQEFYQNDELSGAAYASIFINGLEGFSSSQILGVDLEEGWMKFKEKQTGNITIEYIK